MGTFRRRRHWSIGLGQTGFSLFLTGVILLVWAFVRPPMDGIGDLVKGTPSATFEELQQLPSGTVRLIEATVSSANVELEQGLVAYQRSHGVPDIRNDMVFTVEETRTPELFLEMPGGPVRIDPGYTLFGNMREVTVETERYDGVAVGDTVLVIGSLIDAGAEIHMRASHLILGSLAENQPAHLDMYKIWGGIILTVLGVSIMAWLLSKGYRPFGDRETGK